MLARTVTFCLIVFSLALSGPALGGDMAAAIKAAASVIRVNAIIPGKGSFAGSGVVLPDGRVVTNCHVIRGAKSLVLTDAMTQFLAEPDESNFAADLCILSTATLHAPSATLGRSSDLKAGDEVVAVGFGGGVHKRISRGHITALLPYRGGYVIRTTTPFRSGASGGGLFDRDGRLVGIITFYRRGADAYSFFAIPAEWIETLPFSAVTARADIAPFWMRAHADQPKFLQVVTFEADKDWKSMVRAARAWVKDDPAAAEACTTLVDGIRKTDGPIDVIRELDSALVETVSVALPDLP